VAQTFRENDLPSPCHDDNGRLAFILQRCLRGYANHDVSEKPQKAITAQVVCYMTRLKDTVPNDSDGDTACGQLCGGAWFFAMRSCEYSKVYGDRRTKLLCIENLRFFRDKKELPYDHPELHLADMILITFYFQKNDERDAVVTQHRTHDPELCPVRLWAVIAKRILSYPGTDIHTSVNT
jgi:hypothetical protein